MKEDKSTLLSHPSLTRHFDHIQHLPLVLKAVEGKAGFEQVKVDVEDVPEIVRVAEVKVKKVPKEGEANKEVEKKELEVASAAAAAVATEAGVKKEKPKKEKKEGGEGGGKKVPAPVEVLTPAPWMVDLRVGTIIDGSSSFRLKTRADAGGSETSSRCGYALCRDYRCWGGGTADGRFGLGQVHDYRSEYAFPRFLIRILTNSRARSEGPNAHHGLQPQARQHAWRQILCHGPLRPSTPSSLEQN